MNWQAFRLRALWCWHQLLTLGLALLVVAAVMVGVSRQLLPLVDHYRPQLEAELSARMGLPVTLERLEGEGDGLQLQLRLVQLQLHDPAAPEVVLLRVPEVELRPAVWQSLWHRELRVDVRLRGLDLHFDQQPDGRLQLRELAGLARRDAGTANQTLGFALRQPVLALSESRISLTFQQLPPVTLSNIEVVNRNEGGRHRLAGQLRIPGVNQELSLQLQLEGDPLYWQQGQLQAYLDMPVLNLDGWLPALQRSGLGVEHFRGGGQYWLTFLRGRLASVKARPDWRELALRRPEGRHVLRNLGGQLAWHGSQSGWQAAGQELQGEVDGQPWPLPELAVRANSRGVTVAAAQGRVDGLARLAAGFNLPDALASWLQEAAPAGELRRLRADLTAGPEGGWQLQRLDAEGLALSLRTSEGRPGARNLSGWLRWTPARAWAGLDSHDAEISVPRLLHEPVAARRLQAQLRLSPTPEGWHLDSDRVRLENIDFKAAGVVAADIPRADIHAARLSLLGGLEDGRVTSAWRYLPWKVVSPRAAEWLQHSLRGGRVPKGYFAYEGPLHPSDDDPAHLQLRFAVHQGRLDYAPDWPGLSGLEGEVLLDGPRLEVWGSRARLLDATEGQRLHAVIPDLHEPELQVSAELASSGDDLGRLFRDTPLARHLPGLTDALALEGPLNGHLGLTLPLHGGVPQVAVSARLQDNLLHLKSARLTASHVTGDIFYSTDGGLQGASLAAELLEAPVRADIQTQPGTRTTFVNVAGTASVPALRRWLASGLLDMASGETAYQARVSLPVGAIPRLQLDTSLVGLRLNLPAPLGKTAGEAVPLRYQTSLGGREQMARLQYGQRLSGGLVWQGNRLDRALLRLDSNTAAWPQLSGLEIEGRLPRLDLGEWKPWLGRFQRVAGPQTVAARGQTPMPSLTRMDLETRVLLAEGWQLHNARIAVARAAQAWHVAVDADELSGIAQVPDAPDSEIGLSFSRLQWPLPTVVAAAGKADKRGLSPVAGLGNRPLTIQGEGLRLLAWPGLGQLGLNARLLPIPYGLRVEQIDLHSPVLSFEGQMDWQWRGGVSTSLQGRAGSTNVAGLLAAFGYSPGLVSRRATADLDLSWRGAPDRASLGGLEGRLKLALEDGRLLNVSTGTSVSRIFGWFDFDNLQRRLRGDFSDIVRRGLVFDRVSLEGPLLAGVMQPASFQVSGPTLQAQGQGRLDLGQKKLDQRLTVTVPMSSAVPIAAVVMAGPVVGGAVAAAQMAFEKQLDKATQLHYHVSGDWSSPRVERLGSKNVDALAKSGAVVPAVGAVARKEGE